MNNRDLNEKIPNWVAPPHPKGVVLDGQFVRLAPLTAVDHAAAIHAKNRASDSIWDYLVIGPFGEVGNYQNWVASVEAANDPVFLAIYDKDRNQWGGVASFMRIEQQMGVIEVGNINFAPALQRTRAATEAMYLMMKWAFEAGYRRYEWKCNALNLPSCRAAERYGFSYEGIFRQSNVIKGRNRDTAWFACIDKEWPALEKAFKAWLTADNFRTDGQQKTSLRSLTAPTLVKRDPRIG